MPRQLDPTNPAFLQIKDALSRLSDLSTAPQSMTQRAGKIVSTATELLDFPLQQVLLQEREVDIPGNRAEADDRDKSGKRKNPEQTPSLDKSCQVHDRLPCYSAVPLPRLAVGFLREQSGFDTIFYL